MAAFVIAVIAVVFHQEDCRAHGGGAPCDRHHGKQHCYGKQPDGGVRGKTAKSGDIENQQRADKYPAARRADD